MVLGGGRKKGLVKEGFFWLLIPSLPLKIYWGLNFPKGWFGRELFRVIPFAFLSLYGNSLLSLGF